MRKNTSINQMVRAAVIIALGIVLPIFFHVFGQNAGAVFLPMHIPILIGGFMLNPIYALLTGIITPLLSHLFTGMPAFPFVYIMILELAAYGFFTSLFYNRIKLGIYPSLILAMLIGRGFNIAGVYTIMHMIMGKPFKFKIVATGLFMKGLPGIAIQLILIPLIVYGLRRSLFLERDSRTM
ncbi:ECF transporter S component [Clostridium sp. MB40-C1]|uniref:ECF transporter S component n=1 Tax=Clostridium sp. MB40-C1 TaxID=3070996 RepID=UPI0027E07E5A|nr:ECF transporter S component [Clostridium sp. MB40-C1]WMJ80469.1 ECF transporter S component [Clostridium sp. MB40-C1]